jgi:hypothetical protein
MPSTSHSILQQVELVQDVEYTFTIFSSDEETLSAQDGSYSVILDGTTLFSGSADFGRFESTTFTVAAAARVSPGSDSPPRTRISVPETMTSTLITPAPVKLSPIVTPPVLAVIVIVLDFNTFLPLIGFEITDASGGTVVRVPAGSMPSSSHSILQQVEMVQPGDYTFTISSSAEENLSPEDGSYDVSLDGTTFFSGKANFGKYESMNFTVPLPVPAEEDRPTLLDAPPSTPVEEFNPRIADNSKRESCSIEVCSSSHLESLFSAFQIVLLKYFFHRHSWNARIPLEENAPT